MLQTDCLFSHSSPHPLDGQVFDAIDANDISHLEALFSAGARANAVHPNSGLTALGSAVQQDAQRYDSQQDCQTLSSYMSSNPASNNPVSNNPASNSPALTLCLLERGADINGAGTWGETALMTAAGQGSLPLVTLLLARGARVEVLSDNGDTALSLAAGATQWVALPDASAPQHTAEPEAASARDSGPTQGITRRTSSGLEQLHPAAEGQVIAVVEQLLAAGAQLNRPGCITTPLMEAARHGQLRLLSLLLQRGADPSLTAKDEQTAVGIARLYNQARALTLLEAHLQTQSRRDDHRQSPKLVTA